MLSPPSSTTLHIFFLHPFLFFFFFFNDTATTEIYTLSLHDALPICTTGCAPSAPIRRRTSGSAAPRRSSRAARDRKSTRLNSSHTVISYAVFCLKKKKKRQNKKMTLLKQLVNDRARRELCTSNAVRA